MISFKAPIFLPDATRAVVKSIDTKDIKNTGTQGVVVNTFHLMNTPGNELLQQVGGIHKFMNFDGIVTSDSGGWQVYSLIHKTGKGKISDEGVIFPISKNKREFFTPEKSIQVQMDIGSDIVICLDDFTNPIADEKTTLESIKRTTLWAKRAKSEFEKQVEKRNLSKENTPLLFSVIQGGLFKNMREQSASELTEIGFDGFGFGGYVIDENGQMNYEIAQFTANLIPDNAYKFALGVGSPKDIATCSEFGWQIFDCTLPTRDARHRRLYKFAKTHPGKSDLKETTTYEFVYIDKGKYKEDSLPIDNECDCHTCKNFSRAYLHHLFKIQDTSALRLATIHNLRFYNRVTEILRS